jgi:hypothetical protein
VSGRVPGQLSFRFPGSIPPVSPRPDGGVVTITQAALILDAERDQVLKAALGATDQPRRVGGAIVVDLEEIRRVIHG